MIHLLVIDLTAVIIAGITGLVSITSLVLTLLISRKQTIIHGQIDGMKTELVNAVAGQKMAEGELKGRADAKAEVIVQPVIVQPTDPHVTDEDAKKVADTVVETVKKDPDIEVKKIDKSKTK